MKSSALLSLLAAGILLAGCASQRPKPNSPAPDTSQTIVTPDTSLAAKVVQYNSTGRYVVLGFPIGQLPKAGQVLFIYRSGLKVAEVKTDTWQRDNYVVADLVTGSAQIGDEVRDQ
jgi:PBP1b-binding outer membrane lipoprotein LpoB